MNKQAYERCVGSVISKRASALSDAVAPAVSNIAHEALIPGSSVVNAVGGLVGAFTDPGSKKDSLKRTKQYSNTPGMAFIPGVGGYRAINRRIDQANINGSGSPRAVALSESLGPNTALLLTTLLGGATGVAIQALRHKNRDNMNEDIPNGLLAGAGIGAGIGAGVGLLGSLAGAIGAAATRTRTNEEQAQHDRDAPYFANYLIPGVATYNSYKSLGNRMANE